jgi:hypothetical protein
MFDRSLTRFHDTNLQKSDAVSKVFDRVKSVALWSANIRKLAKDNKGYGSAAMFCSDILLKDHLKKNGRF